jgi:ammonium transporter Rh
VCFRVNTEWLQRARQQQVAKKAEIPPAATYQLKAATWTLFVWQVMLIILFGVVGGTSMVPTDASGNYEIGSPTAAYNMYIGVEIMMFIGFGYLMTFLKWYGLGAVGFSMVLIAVAIQWDLFTEHFWYQMFFHTLQGHWTNVPMHMYALLDTLYAVAAVLISFGAIIGKASPLQLVIMVLIEICCHSFNYEVLMRGTMKIADIGGTYIDHMFGAYFGLAVAYVLGKPKCEPEFGWCFRCFATLCALVIKSFFCVLQPTPVICSP